MLSKVESEEDEDSLQDNTSDSEEESVAPAQMGNIKDDRSIEFDDLFVNTYTPDITSGTSTLNPDNLSFDINDD